MAKTITNPIAVANAVTQLKKWQVVDYQDRLNLSPPRVNIVVQVYQNPTSSYGFFSLVAYDSDVSLGLFVNPQPTTMNDQVILGYVTATGAYTSITNAHDTATGNNKARLLAVENVLISAGLIDAALAGT